MIQVEKVFIGVDFLLGVDFILGVDFLLGVDFYNSTISTRGKQVLHAINLVLQMH